MPVPMIDLCRDKAQLVEVEAAVVRTVRSGHYILGPEVENLEHELAAYLGCRHALTMSSGTDALLVPLMALGIGPADEVVLPTFSFFATAGVVARTGAKPVFIDIEPVHFGIDPQRLEEALKANRRVKAVMAVHLFGAPFDVDAVLAICRRYGVPLIEDAAQAIGTKRNGRMCGGDGLCAAWSTFPTKNLGGIGDGGFLTTEDDALAAKCRLLRNHGMAEQYRHNIIGGNFRMDAIQAAALRVKLRSMEKVTETRRENAAHYRELFAQKRLDTFAQLPTDVVDRHAYHQFVMRLPAASRDAVLSHMRKNGVGSAVYYPIPFHLQPCFQDLGGKVGDHPVAEAASLAVLALPIFQGITEGEQIEVVGTIADFVQHL
ncbi:pleiotropic regulatory protein [Planctomycetota bacterium]|nr:DegT/DnrJ/EryC1/StrS family aminotransferase [Planctomycetota bacterium]GDY02311.1 pleiotropic regulatory protein [Planctomycetota bacterium]